MSRIPKAERFRDLGIASPAAAVPDALPPLPTPKAPADHYFSDQPVYSADEVERIRIAAYAIGRGAAVADYVNGGAAAVEADRARQQDMSVRLAGAPAWQPISEAPRDGSQIILTNGVNVAQGWFVNDTKVGTEVIRDMDGRYVDEIYHEGYQGWMDGDGGMEPEPTHWMPLPLPPEESSTAGAAKGGNGAADTQKMEGASPAEREANTLLKAEMSILEAENAHLQAALADRAQQGEPVASPFVVPKSRHKARDFEGWAEVYADHEIANIVRKAREYQRKVDEKIIARQDAELCRLRSAIKAAAPADAPKLDADELTRLRRLMRALGMDGSVNGSDEYVRGLLFTVLGQAAGKLERAPAAREQQPDDADNLSVMLWLLRRLPRIYENPPHIVQAIQRLAKRTGIDVADSFAERKGSCRATGTDRVQAGEDA